MRLNPARARHALVLAAALAAAIVVSVSPPSAAPAAAHPGDLSGVLKSSDGGATWTYLSAGLVVDTVFALLIDPAQPSTFYAGTERGLFVSRDGGGQWDRQAQAPAGEQVYALAADPERLGGVYAGTSAGLFWSMAGERWQQLGKSTLTGSVRTVLLDTRQPGVIYAGGDSGVMRSADRGVRWTRASGGLPPGIVLDLAADAGRPGVIYAATAQGPYTSSDDGRTWTPLTAGLPAEGVFYVAAGQRPAALYTSVSDRIYRQQNGQAWQEISPPLVCDSFLGRTWVLRLAQSPADAARLFAGSERGVFVSRDGGATWSCPAPFDVTWVQVGAIVFDPRDANVVYAGTSGPPYRNYLVPTGAEGGALPQPVTAASATDWLPALVVLIVFILGSAVLVTFLVRQYRRPAKR